MKLKNSILTLSLLITMTGQPARAGLFPSEVTTTKLQPACVAVYAGGITGPGTGVTVQNNCDYALTVMGVDEVASFVPPIATAVDAYLSNANNPAKYQDAQHRDLTLKLGKDNEGEVCTGASAYESLCKSIALAPGDTLLLFTPARFHIRGTPDLWIEGTTRILPRNATPAKPFGSLPE